MTSTNKPRNESPQTSGRTAASTEMMAACCKRVVHYLETEKRYTQPVYSLWELARETGLTARMISQSINEYIGQNFFELINRMRVAEAKRLLREAARSAEPASLEEIGTRSGFSSRSTFFLRFKAYEGITPGRYMTLHEETK